MNVHKKPLQRSPNLAPNKAKKALAPAPPIGQIGKQRSESAPEYTQPGSDSPEYAPRNFETLNPRSVLPHERTATLGKPVVPPPLPPKKSVGDQQMHDLGFVENSTSFDSKDTSGTSTLRTIRENPLSAAIGTFQADVPDGSRFHGRSFDEAAEEDGSSTVEVFSPVGSCSSPDADDLSSVIKSEYNGGSARESLEPMTTTTATTIQPSIGLINSTAVAADLQNMPAISVNEYAVETEPTHKTPRGPSPQSPRSPQKKPHGDPTSATSPSPQSLLVSLGRKKPIDVSDKSSSLPTPKKRQVVELCRVTPRSESTDNPDAYVLPASKVESPKVRPKAPPRVPVKETRTKVESPGSPQEEATHL